MGFAWKSVYQSPGVAGPHMKCCLYLKCQDLFQYYLSAAHHLLWFVKGAIKGCWCQGPDQSQCWTVCWGSVIMPACCSHASHKQQGAVTGGMMGPTDDGMPESRGWAAALQGRCKGGALLPSDRSFPSRGTSAAAGTLQLIPVPARSHTLSVSQVLQLLQGRKVLLLVLGPYLELFWCFISTRCLSPRCLSQRQTNNSPPGAFSVT